jgi:E3 Ubiquitin ligase
MWIAGVILLVIAIGCVMAFWYQQSKLNVMKHTETRSAKDLIGTARAVASDIGSGAFAELAEVKGIVRCQAPLTSELAKIPCVYYSMTITRQYEETYQEADQQGKMVTRTRQGSDQVARNERRTLFQIEDQTGRITIDPTDGQLTTEKVHARFESGSWLDAAYSIATGAGTRTLGYEYEEWAIPVGHQLYVLGEATDASGELRVQRPADTGHHFIVSTRSEEALTARATTIIRVLQVCAVVALLAGIGLIGFDMVKK